MKKILLILISILLTGCANNRFIVKQGGITISSKNFSKDDYDSGYTDQYGIEKAYNGVFVLVTKYKGHWKIQSVSESPQNLNSYEGQERLFYNFDTKTISPSFDIAPEKDGLFYICNKNQPYGIEEYTPCVSSLTKVVSYFNGKVLNQSVLVKIVDQTNMGVEVNKKRLGAEQQAYEMKREHNLEMQDRLNEENKLFNDKLEKEKNIARFILDYFATRKRELWRGVFGTKKGLRKTLCYEDFGQGGPYE